MLGVVKKRRKQTQKHSLISSSSLIVMAGSGSSLKNFLPLMDRVLVQKAVARSKTEGGIYLPEKSRGRVVHGLVVAVGPGARTIQGELIPPSVQVGDKVLLPDYGGTRVTLEDDNEYQLFRESSILAKLE
ncbi:10 kDa heat shock protein, mitochondrial-like [Macrosteles quadrilineatus]|uniref:10 kDa heat shock protein, mitochondrial-like n=1 Tax=Macrosteles quadrilineatus TaxID=74068 RepID=UPI0023E2B004|nr:10 kDa heat shock protein, mitochondrial-like [Macrosteles quadrilineatus]